MSLLDMARNNDDLYYFEERLRRKVAHDESTESSATTCRLLRRCVDIVPSWMIMKSDMLESWCGFCDKDY